MFDAADDPGIEGGAGILQADGTAKPAFCVLAGLLGGTCGL
jgi:hypothetical protein